jgi:hypothetical protein
MTRPIVAIERFFERLFERPATRLFHTRLQPVQLLRRLERAMEAERRISADRTYVRDRYRIQLNPSDFADFEGFQAPVEAELADARPPRAVGSGRGGGHRRRRRHARPGGPAAGGRRTATLRTRATRRACRGVRTA